MKIDHEKTCGPCQMGKQIRTSHMMMRHLSTIRVLRTHSLRSNGTNVGGKLMGKSYAFVFVDDFPRYSW